MGDYWWLPVILACATLAALTAVGCYFRWDDRHYRHDPFAHDNPDHEDRLRASLRAAASEIDPGPGGLDAIRERLGHDTHAWPVLDRFAALFPHWRP